MELQVGEVEGYRVFSVPNGSMGKWLRSTGMDWMWTKGDQEACCLKDHLPVQRVHKNVTNEQGEKHLALVELVVHGLIPDEGCDCGFWIMKEPKKLIERMQLAPDLDFASTHYSITANAVSPRFMRSGVVVVGKVQGWGKCIVGADGWRCEYARISAFICGEPDSYPTIVDKKGLKPWAELYDVPIETHDAFSIKDRTLQQRVSKWLK